MKNIFYKNKKQVPIKRPDLPGRSVESRGPGDNVRTRTACEEKDRDLPRKKYVLDVILLVVKIVGTLLAIIELFRA